jgi:hypothetical protein
MERIHHWFDFNLDKLPYSVTEVVYSGLGYDASFYKPLFEMMSDAARNARKKGSMLHSFRVVRTDEDESWGIEGMPYSWEDVVEQVDRRDWTTWGVVTHCVAKLLGVGIKVWDEYGVALSDVIERLGESDRSAPTVTTPTVSRLMLSTLTASIPTALILIVASETETDSNSRKVLRFWGLSLKLSELDDFDLLEDPRC